MYQTISNHQSSNRLTIYFYIVFVCIFYMLIFFKRNWWISYVLPMQNSLRKPQFVSNYRIETTDDSLTFDTTNMMITRCCCVVIHSVICSLFELFATKIISDDSSWLMGYHNPNLCHDQPTSHCAILSCWCCASGGTVAESAAKFRLYHRELFYGGG